MAMAYGSLLAQAGEAGTGAGRAGEAALSWSRLPGTWQDAGEGHTVTPALLDAVTWCTQR